MTLGGLFSGIGGFELGGQRAGITPVWSNEIDPFCCKVLRKNFNHDIIEADIRTIGKGREHELAPVDIICGGFPCQPFSSAGNRKGKDDNRYLWPEMLRTIREVKPSWVVGENVAGILSMDGGAVFEQICASLENEGYQVETYCIPACSIGAPHRRDRVWIIGHSEGKQQCNDRIREGRLQEQTRRSNCNIFTSNATSQNDRRYSREQNCRSTQQLRNSFIKGVTTYSTKPGFQNGRSSSMGESGAKPKSKRRYSGNITTEQFNEHWLQAATRICRVHDGISRRMDRTNRLKALGNAIVPQIAQILFETIFQFENQ